MTVTTKKFRFLEWTVYKDSKELFSFVLSLVNKLPREYRFDIGGQIVRSGLSVMLNIAEGSGKATDKDFNRYLDIALGSLYELVASFDVLRDNGIVAEKEFQVIFNKSSVISDQIGGFKKKLRNSS